MICQVTEKLTYSKKPCFPGFYDDYVRIQVIQWWTGSNLCQKLTDRNWQFRLEIMSDYAQTAMKETFREDWPNSRPKFRNIPAPQQ